MSDLRQRQVELNTSTIQDWELFRDHRAKVSELLLGGVSGDARRLCVIGGGNCNDLKLDELQHRFREIRLVDLDSAALLAGIERQGLSGNPSITAHGDFDATGMLGVLERLTPGAHISDADVAAFAEVPVSAVRPQLPGEFDVAASTCVLSQMISSVAKSIGDGHPKFGPIMQSLRIGHLRLLTSLLAPGGTGILITDIVSSDTCVELWSAGERNLRRLLVQLVHRRNFFHGVNPFMISNAILADPYLETATCGLEQMPPWIWNLGTRVYLVCGFRFRRRR